jgi:apolipoprotein D and lipocalin family protein
MTRRLLFHATLLALLAGGTSIAAGPADLPQPVRSLDLARYAGSWFEIARYPNRFQTKCARDVTASYALQDDGTIEVVNRCRTKEGEPVEAVGRGRKVLDTNPAKLEVRFAPGWLSFLPFVWADYWVIHLAPDYSWAVVGEPKRKYLWILAREPRLDDATYQAIVERLAAQGYDPARIGRTEHSR